MGKLLGRNSGAIFEDQTRFALNAIMLRQIPLFSLSAVLVQQFFAICCSQCWWKVTEYLAEVGVSPNHSTRLQVCGIPGTKLNTGDKHPMAFTAGSTAPSVTLCPAQPTNNKTVQQGTLKNTEQMVWHHWTATKASGLHKTKWWAKIELNMKSRNGKALPGICEMLTFLAWENSLITTKALLCSLAQRRMPIELFIGSKNFIVSLY